MEDFVVRQEEEAIQQKETLAVGKDEILAHQEAEARANMYRFLSTIYLHPPQPDLLWQIADKDFLKALCSLFGGKARADLKEFVATFHPDEDLEALRQEYMDLFVVPTGRYVTPFEDVYRGKTVNGKPEKGILMGEQAIAVRRVYREAGAEIDGECKELPTHIGVELSFMNFLCVREAEAIRNEEGDVQNGEVKRKDDSSRYRAFQRKFLQEHLTRWYPELSQAIQTNTKSQFYRSLALITEEFLAQDTASFLARSS